MCSCVVTSCSATVTIVLIRTDLMLIFSMLCSIKAIRFSEVWLLCDDGFCDHQSKLWGFYAGQSATFPNLTNVLYNLTCDMHPTLNFSLTQIVYQCFFIMWMLLLIKLNQLLVSASNISFWNNWLPMQHQLICARSACTYVACCLHACLDVYSAGQYTGTVSHSRYSGHTGFETACF